MIINLILIVAVITALIIAGAWFALRRNAGPPLPEQLRKGRPLPDFEALDEDGRVVGSGQLRGKPTALIFVRGNWCPFCTRQVEQLVQRYREITDLGARLVFVTPKPIDTTRRVAAFFKVEFEYWLDEDLNAARHLGLLLQDGVPESYASEYGADTMWPATFIVDKDGVIRFARLSRYIADRPNPRKLLRVLRSLPG